MGSCCGKRETTGKTDGSGGSTANLGGITSNEVPKMIEFATKFLDDFPENRVITLNI